MNAPDTPEKLALDATKIEPLMAHVADFAAMLRVLAAQHGLAMHVSDEDALCILSNYIGHDSSYRFAEHWSGQRRYLSLLQQSTPMLTMVHSRFEPVSVVCHSAFQAKWLVKHLLDRHSEQVLSNVMAGHGGKVVYQSQECSATNMLKVGYSLGLTLEIFNSEHSLTKMLRKLKSGSLFMARDGVVERLVGLGANSSLESNSLIALFDKGPAVKTTSRSMVWVGFTQDLETDTKYCPRDELQQRADQESFWRLERAVRHVSGNSVPLWRLNIEQHVKGEVCPRRLEVSCSRIIEDHLPVNGFPGVFETDEAMLKQLGVFNVNVL